MTSEDAPGRGKAAQACPAELAASFLNTLQVTLTASAAALGTIAENLDASGPASSDAANGTDLAPVVGRAMLAAAGSSARYWRDLAALCGRHPACLAQLAGTPPAPDTEQARIAADDLRALLREAGDIATLEVLRLQQEFLALDEAVAARMSATDAGPVRRWRAKA